MLIADQKKIKNALVALVSQTGEAGTSLTAQQWTAFKTYWDRYVVSLHHHHANEEKIAFPYYSDVKKVVCKEKLTSDHVTLISGLEKVESIISKINTESITRQAEEQAKALRDLLESYTVLDEALVEHFHEEEDTFLAPLRKVCTVKEVRKYVSNPIISGLTWEDRGQYFGKLDPETQLKPFMKQEGIPFFVKWIFKANIRKYNKMYELPLKEAVSHAKECIAAASVKVEPEIAASNTAITAEC